MSEKLSNNFELITQPNVYERGWLNLGLTYGNFIAVGNPSEKQYIGFHLMSYDENIANIFITERQGEEEIEIGKVELEQEVRYNLKGTSLKFFWKHNPNPDAANIKIKFKAPRNVDLTRIALPHTTKELESE